MANKRWYYNEYEKRFKYASENTSLPKHHNYKKLEELKMYVNENIILNHISERFKNE